MHPYCIIQKIRRLSGLRNEHICYTSCTNTLTCLKEVKMLDFFTFFLCRRWYLSPIKELWYVFNMIESFSCYHLVTWHELMIIRLLLLARTCMIGPNTGMIFPASSASQSMPLKKRWFFMSQKPRSPAPSRLDGSFSNNWHGSKITSKYLHHPCTYYSSILTC